MVNAFINPVVKSSNVDRKDQFYQAYQPFKDSDPVELCVGDSAEAAEVVIRAAYRQVLGNAHVMESERLTVAESKLKRGELSVREFVRTLAKSELYRSRFFDNCYRYRAIELNYKHLLGRAPDNFDEMRYHSQILDQSGFDADIDSYLDSDEYQANFGETIVPYYRGYQTQVGQSMLEFTNMFQLLRSASSSDKDIAGQNQPQLTRSLIKNSPYGQMKVRDVSEIFAQVFPTTTSWSPPLPSVQTVSPTLDAQAKTIAQLQQQLADLRPFASIGTAYLNGDWQPEGSATKPAGSSPQAQIETLQAQIADARRHATIGEARLNKWRSKSFG
jgi:phycoerythrin-associated linker protein